MSQFYLPPVLLEQLKSHSDISRALFLGYITDAIQFNHLYEIAVESGAPVWGVATNHSNHGYIGYRPHSMYMPGTRVLCYRQNGSAYCWILGAIPSKVGEPLVNQPDWIHQQSGVGITNDVAHKAILGMPGEKPNYNSHRPYDTFPGELGWTNPLGMAINMGLSSITLRAGDATGLWLFYLNQGMRLAAQQYELWTALTDFISGNDEGENYSIERSSPYPWEMNGVSTPGTDFTKTVLDPQEQLQDGVDKLWAEGGQQTNYEPKQPDQVGIPRLTEVGGYLGDLQQSIVSCPPSNVGRETDGVETLSNKTDYIGLSSVFRGSNGVVEVRSRKSITLEKSSYIPAIKQIKTADDPTGNTRENGYNPAGFFNQAGDKHDRTEFDGSDLTTAAQLFDRFAWTRAKFGLQGLYRHNKDWHVSEETKTEGYSESVDSAVYLPSGSQYRAAFPAYAEVIVDHRPNSSVKLYKTRSMVHLADNGGIVIEDGWGSQIIMEHGNITFTCQGDVTIANGRNFNVLAPNDVCIRAGNCADLSAGRGDVRIKADKNLHMLAGNSGSGGALIESRGAGFAQDFVSKYGTDVKSAGIILKATHGSCAMYGESVYLRSLSNGSVIIDADAGNGDVQIYGNRIVKLLASNESTIFGSTPNRPDSAIASMYVGPDVVTFGQRNMFINGGFFANGGGVFQGGVAAQSVGTNTGGEMGTLTQSAYNDINDAANQFQDILNSNAPLAGEPFKSGKPYDANNGAGLAQVIKNLGFTFRLDTQYGMSYNQGNINQFLVEARWQQMFRINKSSEAKWVEKPVKSPDGDMLTMPYPGNENWTVKTLYTTVDLSYWTAKKGETYGIDGYTAAKGGESTSVTLADGFLINPQNS